MKKTKTSLARKIFIVFDYLVLIFLAVVCLLPILHVAFASVSDPNWVMNQSGLILKPHGFTLEGYKLVFQTRQLMGSYGNTLFYVFASTALGMLITVLGAYPLSKSDLLWSNALMLIISFTMMFSGGIITFYMVVRSRTIPALRLFFRRVSAHLTLFWSERQWQRFRKNWKNLRVWMGQDQLLYFLRLFFH